jgi:hypothetical protein
MAGALHRPFLLSLFRYKIITAGWTRCGTPFIHKRSGRRQRPIVMCFADFKLW